MENKFDSLTIRGCVDIMHKLMTSYEINFKGHTYEASDISDLAQTIIDIRNFE